MAQNLDRNALQNVCHEASELVDKYLLSKDGGKVRSSGQDVVVESMEVISQALDRFE